MEEGNSEFQQNILQFPQKKAHAKRLKTIIPWFLSGSKSDPSLIASLYLVLWAGWGR